jgi:hypothetical protein
MKKNITRDEWSTLVLMIAILLGVFMRFNLTMLAGFAINDGGMFAVMVDDLRANHYLIPAFTTYNHFNIPFAYPPLGFYFGAFAVDLFKMTAIQALRWVPPFFASLSIPAFYLLSLRLFKDKYYASLSTLFFALMPRAFSWFVMGGGLTRSPGQFFMLLTLFFVLRLYEENRRGDIFWAGLFGGLAVMSHPEAAVHTVVSAVLFWTMFSRKRNTFIQSVLVGVVVFLVTALWWGTVIAYHGTEPLFNAAATGKKLIAVFNLVFFVFTEEPYATFIAILGLIGLAHRLIRRDYLLPIWMAIPFFVEGRSAAGPAAIPLAMLAAVGLVDVIFPALQALVKNESDVSVALQPIERNVTIYLMLYLVFSAYQFGFQLSAATLYPEDQEAMVWARENTPDNSRFLVMTGSLSVSCDSVVEWSPALTGRQSLYTVQGTEWTKGDNFGSFIQAENDLQTCYLDGPSCVDGVISPSEYDYVYLSKSLRVENCRPSASVRTFPYYVEGVRADERYEIVYETDGAMIYKNR